MSESTPNPATSEATAAPTDPEGLDAAELAFSKQGQQPTQAADPGTEPEDESDSTEADAADPEADEATDDLVQVEFEGKQYELPPELQKALLRQSDYSRKMNEVTSQEKAYTERLKAVETITEGAEKYAEALASVRMVEAQLKQYEAINWDQVEQADPQNAARLAVQQLRLQRQYQAAQDAAKTIGDQVQSEKGQLFQAARADMVKALEKNGVKYSDIEPVFLAPADARAAFLRDVAEHDAADFVLFEIERHANQRLAFAEGGFEVLALAGDEHDHLTHHHIVETVYFGDTV